MLYCRVALQGPNGETLGGWVDDSLVALGELVQVDQDSSGRPWRVAEIAPNLMLPSQVQAEHRLAVVQITGAPRSDISVESHMAQAVKRPRKLKSAQVEAN